MSLLIDPRLTMIKSILTSTLALVSLSLVSCSGTSNPFTTPATVNAQQKALGGAAIGGVAGLLLGDDSNDRLKKGVIGTAAGAGAGYLYGQNQDANSSSN